MRAWIRANIIGGPENGYNRPRPEAAAAPPHPGASDPRETEVRLIAPVERVEELKDGLETALHAREPLHVDIGGTLLGFVSGVLVRVLAHIIAMPDRKADK